MVKNKQNVYFCPMVKKKESKTKPKDTPNPNHKEDFMKVLELAVKTPKASKK